MKYKAIKAFNHDELGRVAAGQEFDATDAQVSPVLGFVVMLAAKPADPESHGGKKGKGK